MGMIELKLLQDRMNELEKRVMSMNEKYGPILPRNTYTRKQVGGNSGGEVLNLFGSGYVLEAWATYGCMPSGGYCGAATGIIGIDDRFEITVGPPSGGGEVRFSTKNDVFGYKPPNESTTIKSSVTFDFPIRFENHLVVSSIIPTGYQSFFLYLRVGSCGRKSKLKKKKTRKGGGTL